MKYHYKSPQQIRDEAVRQRESGPAARKRNRSTLILLADLAIILLIFGTLYYTGVWPPREFASDEVWRRGPFEFSASLRKEIGTGSGGAGDRLSFYLNVKNDSGEALVFPAEGFAAFAQISAQGGQVPDAGENSGARFTARMPLEERSIAPGETTIYRETIQLPAGAGLAEGGRARLTLETPDAPVEIELP